jgi:hypothetical protein
LGHFQEDQLVHSKAEQRSLMAKPHIFFIFVPIAISFYNQERSLLVVEIHHPFVHCT